MARLASRTAEGIAARPGQGGGSSKGASNAWEVGRVRDVCAPRPFSSTWTRKRSPGCGWSPARHCSAYPTVSGPRSAQRSTPSCTVVKHATTTIRPDVSVPHPFSFANAASNSPDFPYQVLGADFLPRLLVVVKPFPLRQVHARELGAGLQPVCQPGSLLSWFHEIVSRVPATAPYESVLSYLRVKLRKLQPPAVKVDQPLCPGRLTVLVGRRCCLDGSRRLSLLSPRVSQGLVQHVYPQGTSHHGVTDLAVLAPPHKVCFASAPAHLLLVLPTGLISRRSPQIE